MCRTQALVRKPLMDSSHRAYLLQQTSDADSGPKLLQMSITQSRLKRGSRARVNITLAARVRIYAKFGGLARRFRIV
jgi:hypothetical protein